MSKIVYEAIAKAGTYKDRNGDDKVRFHKCGVVFEGRDGKGLNLKVESLPVGFDGWLSLREPRPKEQTASGGAQPAAAASGEKSFEDDDVPF